MTVLETTSNASSEALLRQAMQALKVGNLPDAANFAEQARAVEQSAPVLCVFAAISHAVGRDADALAMLDQAMQLEPTVANYPDAAAAILLKLGRKADGLFNLKLGTHFERDPSVSDLIGDFFGDIEAIFDSFIENRPLKTAKIMMTQNMFSAAYRQLETFISISGGDAESFALIAECAVQIGQIDAAEIAIKALASLDDQSADLADLTLALAVLRGDHAASRLAYDALIKPKDLMQALRRFRVLAAAQTLSQLDWKAEVDQVLSYVPDLDGIEPLRRLNNSDNFTLGFLCDSINANIEFLLSALSQKTNIKVYCTGTDGTPSKQRLKSTIDDWRDVADIDTETLVEMIRFDGVSVLFDMAGVTVNQRLAVLSACAAPLQAGLLHEIPFESASLYNLRVVSPSDPISDPQQNRIVLNNYLRFPLPPSEYMGRLAELRGLLSKKKHESSEKFKFLIPHLQSGVTNNSLKIWRDILQKSANSLIIFVAAPDLGAEIVRRILTEIEGDDLIERVELIDPEEFVKSRHSFLIEADLILDSFPRSNVIAAEESLWIGCPFLTLRGTETVDGAGAALLDSVGLSLLSARDEADYVAKAVEWASDPVAFAGVRKTILAARDGLNLKAYETAADELFEKTREFWQEWCKLQS